MVSVKIHETHVFETSDNQKGYQPCRIPGWIENEKKRVENHHRNNFAKSGLIWFSVLWGKKLKCEKLTEAHDDIHLGHKAMTLSYIDLWSSWGDKHTCLIFTLYISVISIL